MIQQNWIEYILIKNKSGLKSNISFTIYSIRLYIFLSLVSHTHKIIRRERKCKWLWEVEGNKGVENSSNSKYNSTKKVSLLFA